jgi:hypothetical protein
LAQPGPGGGPGMGGMDLSFMKLFGDNTGFTAQSQMKITDSSGAEVMSMSAAVAVSDGKMRMDVDMANMKGAMIPPGALAQMKQMGMDHTISVTRPDKKLAYVIYPGLKMYASMPIPDDALKSLNSKAKVDKTELGKETIDGHPCVKNKMTIADDAGKAHEFTVWNATDLKDFPVQFQTSDNGQTIVSTYKGVRLSAPDAKQFEPPSDYKGYDDMQQMQMAVMQKMLDQQHQQQDTSK